jgi:hypothetical protein
LAEQQQVLANKIAGLNAELLDTGNTNEDVRRLEHPEEFLDPEDTEAASDADTEAAEPVPDPVS